MSRLELAPEDLIYQSENGKTLINHDLIQQVGLFNLNSKTLDLVLRAYQRNAVEQGEKEAFMMRVFIRLTKHIQAFPFPVVTNFTSGPAYEYNLNNLSRFAGEEGKASA
ncbi:MAG: hypothetical protein H6510_02410 [Acidobacteria bacterium]|nr:hypothetical protein [Acidobacteriota bacterium]MCB9396647.1 hypothetical protein [Acidobacteriota bacterium]